EVCEEGGGDRIIDRREDDWTRRALLPDCPRCRCAGRDDHLGSKPRQLGRIGTDTVEIGSAEAKVDPQVLTFDPAELRKCLLECRNAGLLRRIVLGAA